MRTSDILTWRFRSAAWFEGHLYILPLGYLTLYLHLEEWWSIEGFERNGKPAHQRDLSRKSFALQEALHWKLRWLLHLHQECEIRPCNNSTLRFLPATLPTTQGSTAIKVSWRRFHWAETHQFVNWLLRTFPESILLQYKSSQYQWIIAFLLGYNFGNSATRLRVSGISVATLGYFDKFITTFRLPLELML
jgi:hypothetical protein